MQTERRGTRYEDDFVGWADEQAAALAEGRVADLDLVNLADEIGSLSSRDRRQVQSRLEVLLLHLLKQEHQPERATRSWKATERHQANKIQGLVEDSPSLGPYIETAVPKAYGRARERAAFETGLPPETFPEQPSATLLAALRAKLEEAGIRLD
jgi:hypothetical protein